METDLLILLIFFYIPNTKCLSEHLAGLNSKEVIQKYGYPLEIHSIETDDGYILETYRIPYGKGKSTTRLRQPVLLMPGLLGSSVSYVNFGPENSLGFILADNGYDVWLANYRGKTSRKHKTLDPILNKKEFFDFSFQEVGLFDVKAHIDYILDITKQKSLFYIGYSIGTTTVFALTSTRLEYNNKIILMIAMGPMANISNIRFTLVPFGKRYFKEIQEVAERYGVYELFLYSPTVTWFLETFCQDSATTQLICSFVLYFIGGYTPHLNKTMLPVILTEFSIGSSVRTFFHYIQLTISERFQMYDFGAVENVRRYGQQTPPLFNVSEITTPVALYYGGADLMSTPRDVEQLARELPNVVKRKFIETYNHFDFVYSTDMKSVLYGSIISTMKEYSK